MDAGLIAFIAGMIGLLVGVLSMNAVARSERERERSLVSAPTLRDGAAQVLAVIGRAYLVIDEVGGVVQASPGAYAMGLVRGHTVTSPELASMMFAWHPWATNTSWCLPTTAPKFLACNACVTTSWRTCRTS